jgi:hypothetical protein
VPWSVDGSSSAAADHVNSGWTDSSSSGGVADKGDTTNNTATTIASSSNSSSGLKEDAEDGRRAAAAAADSAAAAAAAGGRQHNGYPSSGDGVSDNTGAASPGTWQQQWRVMGIHFDAADAAGGGVLPQQPHPRHPPETIVLAQLAALRSRDLHTAAGFNILGRHHTAGWAVQLAAFQQLLERPDCQLLLSHTDVRLASAACPLPRQFLLEVVLQNNMAGTRMRGRSGPAAVAAGVAGTSQHQGGTQQQEGRFLWRMAMHADGCWLVKAIEAL